MTQERVLKDSLPPDYVYETEALVDARAARPMRKGEAFSRPDLLRIAPDGPPRVRVTIQHGEGDAFVTVGGRVHIIATFRSGKRLESRVVAQNAVVAAHSSNSNESLILSLATSSMVIDPKEMELVELAKARGCVFDLMVLDPTYPIESGRVEFEHVKKLLESLPLATPTGQ